jgi:pantothenate kinase
MEISGGFADAYTILQDRLLSLLNNSPLKRRIIIALAGVPGSGKSTIATGLLAHLDRAGVRDVVVAPMVCFHDQIDGVTSFFADAHRTATTI